ncbi:MAG TPA: hypothetical protein PLY86_16440 [bacterium]|nr:hypothetical protein [bacterium]
MQAKIEVSQSSLDLLLKAANSVIMKLRGVRTIELEAIGAYAVSKLRERTPGKRAPKTWRMEISHNADETALRIFSEMTKDPETETILRVLEYGSKPHRIYPRTPKGVLHFFVGDPLGGMVEEVFTKHVDHPGTKPHRMLQDTGDDLSNLLTRLVRSSELEVQRDWER